MLKKENFHLKYLEIFCKVFFIVSASTLYFDLLYSIDFSSGGLSKDFQLTFPIIKRLANYNFLHCCAETRHFPFHYFLLSVIYNISNSEYLMRAIYLLFFGSIPYLIFANLKIVYKEVPKYKLILFSALLFYLPFFRSSLVWANAHSTGLLFLFASTLFLLKFINNKKSKEIYVSLFFLSLAVYSVQYYAAFYLIFFYKLYHIKNIYFFYKILLFCVFTSIPGFLFLIYLPNTLDIPFSNNYANVLIINFSIIFFYLLALLNLKNIKFISSNFNIQNKKYFWLFISILFILILSLNFDYPFFVGGGFFYKLSLFLFENKYFFYITSFWGVFLLIFQNTNNTEKLDIAFVFITFLIISFSYQIYMKYFEPSFIIVSMIFAKRNIFINVFKDLYFTGFYFIFYLIIAFINSYYLI